MIRNNLSDTPKKFHFPALRRRRPNERTNERLEVIRIAHSAEINGRRSERMEDYLEVIYELLNYKGYASPVEIAECLNVSKPSVSKMLRRLDGSGLINYKKYRDPKLTKEGIRIAKEIHERHSILVQFLRLIGVDENIANRDAEAIEHHVHPETLTKLRRALKYRNAKVPIF